MNSVKLEKKTIKLLRNCIKVFLSKARYHKGRNLSIQNFDLSTVSNDFHY